MTWWKRTFGLHPVDMAIHALIGGLVVGAAADVTGIDAVGMVGTAGIFLVYAWRRHRALAALPAEGMTSGEVKLAELDAQAEELHDLRTRMGELEERLDFTERLLARQREPEQLPRG
jgi:proteasome assembly chaperone (PAC2) family protein